jgi:hypothetical protein
VSRKLFLQIVALIAIALAMYFVLLLVRDWQARSDYNARMEQIKADTDNRLRDLRTGLSNTL